MKNRCPSEKNSKIVRISIGDYVLLTEVSRRASVTMAEALHLLLERQEREPDRELEQVTKGSPIQTRMLDIVMPSQVTARVTPSQVTGNGVAHIQPKIIKEVS